MFFKCQNSQDCRSPRSYAAFSLSSPHGVNGASHKLVVAARVKTVPSCVWLLPDTLLFALINLYHDTQFLCRTPRPSSWSLRRRCLVSRRNTELGRAPAQTELRRLHEHHLIAFDLRQNWTPEIHVEDEGGRHHT